MKILVLDVGGTFIKFAVMNERAEFFQRGKILTPLNSRADFFDAIYKMFTADKFDGVAISIPGIIDATRGICLKSSALPYNDGANIVAELEKICGVKVTIENDANCAALAEAKIGNLAEVADGFVMVFGTMIGGAVIKNHAVHKGKNFLAGEISFSILSGESFYKSCSVPALLKSYAQIKNLSNAVTGENFFAACAAKENDALACLDKFTRQIAIQIFNIQMLLDVEKIAVGGGISAQEIFINSIRENLDKVYNSCEIEFPRVKVVPCKFRNDANLIGALMHWLAN